MSISKQQIAKSFSHAAQTYDAAAFLQNEVADRVFDRLEIIRTNPKAILDVGCGTGYCSRLLRKKFKHANIFGVDIAPGMIEKANSNQSLFRKIKYQVADADYLPFDDNTFDLVFSSLTIQWMPDVAKTFAELNRVLKPGGVIIFSTLGPDTLIELKESWAQVDDGVHVNEFIDMHIVGDKVFSSQFENVVMDRDVITLTYKTLQGLMKDLKAIGAHNIDNERSKGLTGKSKFEKLKSAYESFRWKSGELPATYEVIYGHAWKKAKPTAEPHVYSVSLENK